MVGAVASSTNRRSPERTVQSGDIRPRDGMGSVLGRWRTEWQLALAVAALALAFSLVYPQFGTLSNAENMARQGATLLVVAIGQSFALLVGGFDISVGANMGLASTAGALVMREHGVLLGLVAGIGAATMVGLVNGLLIGKLRVTPFVATLGMLAFARGLANHISSGASVSGLPPSFGYFGRLGWGPIPSTVGLAAIVLLLAWIVLTRTRLGLYLYAIGGSRQGATLAGVPVARYEIFAYTACGFLAGVAGMMLASRVSVGQASLGQGFELLSIATAVIGGVAIGGGVGRLSGVILGVALLSVMTTGMNIARLSEFIQQMLTGLVLIAAVLIDQFRGRGRWRTLTRLILPVKGPPDVTQFEASQTSDPATTPDSTADHDPNPPTKER